MNPFSPLPYSGETFLKGVLWLIFKFILVLYSLVDISSSYTTSFSLIFTFMVFLFIIFSHY